MTEQQARDFAVALGAEIAYWRKARKMNRAQLSAMVDVSETTLGRIERGDETAAAASSLVWRLAAALGLSFSELVRRAEEALDLGGDYSTWSDETMLKEALLSIQAGREIPAGNKYARTSKGEILTLSLPYIVAAVEVADVSEPSEGDLEPTEERNDAEQG